MNLIGTGILFIACSLSLFILIDNFISWPLSEERRPAFLYQKRVDISDKDHSTGSLYMLCQTNDEGVFECANSMTVGPALTDMGSPLISSDQYGCPLSLDQSVYEEKIESKSLQHIGAAKLISLGIPLHPDCMTAADWERLPGIGVKTADSIVKDRQVNGDFGALDQVVRVRSVGKKTIGKIRKYFD